MQEINTIQKCSICLEDLSDEIYTLECNHKFHTKCIIKWFRNDNSTCPLCKDIKTYSNLSYWQKIDTIAEIKKLGRRKNCPDKLKKILNKIKEEKKKENDYKNYCKEFKSKYKEILKEYSNIRRSNIKFYRNIRRFERELLQFITINPIYIKK